MHHWFKNFLKRNYTYEVLLTSFGVIIFLGVVRSLGLLQTLEWSAYDLLFFLRPSEAKDERIVIVSWDEEDLQIAESGIISDNTLAVILERIKEQEPRVIGLDIFRDVRVPSLVLSDEENKQAYKKLVELFRSTPNLLGIEKVIPPLINPPLALAEKNQITAADLVTDEDNTVRRAYIHPLVDELGNPALPPSLGVLLAYKYLVREGFEAEKLEGNALKMFQRQTEEFIILKPLKKLDGSYLKYEEGTKILVNWRKGNPRFEEVFVSEVAADLIPADIFKDKIVLIGNISASGGDRHYLPINRWTEFPETSGVEIHGQIASSIISAALDKRPLIKTIPEWSEWGIVTITVLVISSIAEKYRSKKPTIICLICYGGALVIGSVLSLGSILAFSEGYWIPIVPSLLASILSPVVICLTIYISRIKAANEDFKQLIQDLNHSLQNPLRSITENVETAYEIAKELHQADNLASKIDELSSYLEECPLSVLHDNLEDLQNQALLLNYQRENAQQYFNVTYLEQEIFHQEPTFLNEFIQTNVETILKFKQSNYKLTIELEQNYDSQIKEISIDRNGFRRILENLLDNSFYAIQEKKKKIPEYFGVVSIKTNQKKNKIEISIADNGIGIDSAIKKEIFRPFKSFKAKNKGQGLGLPLAKETLSRHQGNIRVETKTAEGCTFILELPNK